jgi:hypothetical protein
VERVGRERNVTVLLMMCNLMYGDSPCAMMSWPLFIGAKCNDWTNRNWTPGLGLEMARPWPILDLGTFLQILRPWGLSCNKEDWTDMQFLRLEEKIETKKD